MDKYHTLEELVAGFKTLSNNIKKVLSSTKPVDIEKLPLEQRMRVINIRRIK